MGRNYTTGDFESIVAAFRKRYPDITLSTDMIVRFSGETEDDFSRSLERLRQIGKAKQGERDQVFGAAGYSPVMVSRSC